MGTELAVQAALRSGRTPADLATSLGIRVYEHPSLPLVGFKYDQIDSPRFDPIVRDCRGIVLERGSWNVVARPFRRFYNVEEHPEETRGFLWPATAAHKEDVVLRDAANVRLKVKTPEYLALSHMKDNGNLFREKNLVPWALREDPTELLTHFPECEAKLRAVAWTVARAWGDLAAAWHAHRGIADQKTFALAIKSLTPFTGLLFAARKRFGAGLGPLETLRAEFRSEPERVAKVLYG